MELSTRTALACSALILLFTAIDARSAESGFYVGGSLGSAAVEANVDDSGIVLPDPPPVFDEDDFGWKIFAGYSIALGDAFSLGLEGGYNDLGEPSASIADVPVSIDPTAWTVFGTAGIDVGPIGIFGKYGLIDWDVDAFVDDIPFSDDGSDPAYGVGIRANLGNLELRGEYEIFDVSDVEDVTLLSLGFVYRF